MFIAVATFVEHFFVPSCRKPYKTSNNVLNNMKFCSMPHYNGAMAIAPYGHGERYQLMYILHFSTYSAIFRYHLYQSTEKHMSG